MARNQDKSLHEKHQAILSRLLKDEDNKYCVDCDAKGPRWASWNIGIFLCIRCAGIHRNLGVHISKVKSINLDSWTPEQIASVEDMGNSRARAVYEANLPDNYKRPTSSDSAMEQFIRAKYEHKKYIAKEWVPPKPRSAPSHYYDTEKDSKKETKRQTKTVITIPGAAAGTAAAKTAKQEKTTTPVKQEENQASLMVDLNSPAKQATSPAQSAAAPPASSSDLLADIFSSPSVASTAGINSTGNADLFGLNTSPAGSQPLANGTQNSSGDASQDLFKAAEEKNQTTKDSIMALFGNTPSPQQQPNMMQQQQAFNMQGSYTQQPQGQMMYSNQGMMQPGMMNYQMPQQQNMMTNSQQGMYQQQGMMGMPQQGMMSNPQQGMMGNPQQGMMGMNMQQQGMMGMPQQGYYNQQQQMYATQQLQSQLANMSFNQQSQKMPAQTVGNPNASWGAQSGQTNGQTLNFDLWN